MSASDRPLYGYVAEFDSPERLVDACVQARTAGYTLLGAYTPYPIEAVWEAIGHHRSRLPLIVLAGGILGCISAFGFQYWASAIAYPMNIGGRPYASWIAFIPPAFETTILFAALFAVLGMFALNGLPMPYHPIFNVDRFVEASRDRFFLMIRAADPRFDVQESWRFLEGLGPDALEEVPE